MVKVQGCDRLVLLQSIGHLNDTRDTEFAATQVEILDAIVDSKGWSKDLSTLLPEWAKTRREVSNRTGLTSSGHQLTVVFAL